MAKRTICLQDARKDIKPIKEQAQKYIAHLKEIMPDQEFCMSGGYIGRWVMMPNGATCFHCPACYMEVNQ